MMDGYTFIFHTHEIYMVINMVINMEFVVGESKAWKTGDSVVVSIPKIIRNNLGISPGDTVIFKLVDGKIMIEKKEEKRSGERKKKKARKKAAEKKSEAGEIEAWVEELKRVEEG